MANTDYDRDWNRQGDYYSGYYDRDRDNWDRYPNYGNRYGQRNTWNNQGRYGNDNYGTGRYYSGSGANNDYYTTSNPTGWTYTELWLIPGPFSGVGPQGYQRSDDRIRDDINDRLTQHGQINASNIQVQVNNGEVTLTGNVQSRQAKRQAEDVADSVAGVQDVHNQLKISQSQQNQQGQQQTQSSGSTKH